MVAAFNDSIDVLGVGEEKRMDADEGENGGEIAGPSLLPSPPPLTFDSDTDYDDDDDATTRLELAFDRAVDSPSTPQARICKYTFTPFLAAQYYAFTRYTLLV